MIFAAAVLAAAVEPSYQTGEQIPLFVDTVGPHNNPQESYRYYDLPYVRPESPKMKSQSLGEVLQGSEKMYSLYDVKFKQPTPLTQLRKVTLTSDDVALFRKAVQQQYFFTMYFDDIPLRGFVGEIDPQTQTLYVFTHHAFKFQYNRDNVIDAKVELDRDHRLALAEGASGVPMTFTYTVDWKESHVRYVDRSANPYKHVTEEDSGIQWFAIANSLAMVVLLVGFVTFILARVLNKDYQRYKLLEEGDADADETGWKLLHGDVFRPPPMLSLFAAIMGSGTQLLLLFLMMLTLAVVGVFNPYGRGTMYAAIILLYSITAIVSGVVSAWFYTRFGGKAWAYTTMLTLTLFTVPVFVVWAYLNTVAIVSGITLALPFGTIVALFALYILVAFPLTMFGTSAGRHFTTPWTGLVSPTPRVVPAVPLYRSPLVYVLVAGFLPFTSIYVSLYFVFNSLWGHSLYAPYSILYLVFAILLVVTACITIALTYLQLSAENHHWWWLSLASGGSCGLFVLWYSVYFLISESKMSGFVQLSYYFGFNALICYALFLVLGTIGVVASLAFIIRIYETVRAD